jgi:hypothetical protein
MDQDPRLSALDRHQAAALAILAEGVAVIERGPDAVIAEGPALRERMAAVLGGYQHFKHAEIFDPAIQSGDAGRTALGRAMKVECIGAGEVFRAHLSRWTPDAIRRDWADYKVAARLTVNGLRRHIAAERDGIPKLIRAYAA